MILPTNPMPETEEEKETKRMERIMAWLAQDDED